MKIRLPRLLIASALAICLLLPQIASADGQNSGILNGSDDYIVSIMEMIKERYRFEVTDSELLEGALKGIFGSMDPYTEYMTAAEEESFYESINGGYYGIGISMSKIGDHIKVTKVFESSPAERAGVYAGDIIVSIGGVNTADMAVKDAVELIRGQKGSRVVLGILRGDLRKQEDIELLTGEVSMRLVKHDISDGKGYIKIASFGGAAVDEFIDALKQMEDNGIRDIVLDLRDNSGGYVEAAVAIASKLVPRGLVTRLEFKEGYKENIKYESPLDEVKYKLSVLVNRNTASASEILAGAIQDTGVGRLVGEKTFGKARVQYIVPILTPEAYKKYSDELGVKIVDASKLLWEYGINPAEEEILGSSKITMGVYTTPHGRMIDKVGLKPDVEVSRDLPGSGIDTDSIENLTVTWKPGLNDEGGDIYYAEQILKLLGYDIDEPDSLLDKKTYAAVGEFQKLKGGGPYGFGRLDFTTQKWLNEELNRLRLENDKQYARAVELLKN
ncbi:carboxyl-terminal processing protease [Anaerobacterium chartisolvens]|uniref:Carboxyl-terminal processing protease n=1 Tax=Anaerobacterium chartisolvens TaxID=1297424 RepID=A0A369B959_9FIRM|nr:S41 family peptidase [Anaerobacterium chartisolvens]RCX17855.1 carboxyl-terminal processing protease [Anaerobacterium chartisolvens]